MVVVLNKSEELQRVDLTLPEFFEYQLAEDVLSGERFPVERERVSVIVDPMSWRVLKLTD
jgi:hypothetical protein